MNCLFEKYNEFMLTPQKYVLSKYSPENTDSLFWCIYIGIYGMDEYNYSINEHSKNIEIKEKEKIMNHIKQNSNSLKTSVNHKMSNDDIQVMMSNIMTNPISSFQELVGYVYFYKINVFIVWNKMYMCFLHDKTKENISIENTFFIKKTFKNKYEIHLTNIEEKIENMRANFFKIETFKKPLKAVNYYKFTELKKIAFILDIEWDENTKKKDLYDSIYRVCMETL